MTPKALIFLYKEHVSNLPEVIKFAEYNSIDMIITPIVNPLFHREFEVATLSERHIKFTRPDLILEPNIWASKIICKLSDTADCDSDNYDVRMHAEKTIQQEINFAQHLACHGTMLMRLHGLNTVNLARTITRNLTGIFFHPSIWMIDYD